VRKVGIEIPGRSDPLSFGVKDLDPKLLIWDTDSTVFHHKNGHLLKKSIYKISQIHKNYHSLTFFLDESVIPSVFSNKRTGTIFSHHLKVKEKSGFKISNIQFEDPEP